MTCLRQWVNSTLSNVFANKFVKKKKDYIKIKILTIINRTLDNVKCIYVYEYMCEYILVYTHELNFAQIETTI